MPAQKASTLSELYFLKLYRAATLRGAAERAACNERAPLLKGFADYGDIPIDVERIAERKGVQISRYLDADGCEEAKLLPVKRGFIVQLKRESSEARKRFSLAHELGHTLFYRDDGLGPRHQIGVLDATEIQAEERICNLFARTLLVPASRLRSVIAPISSHSPWSLLDSLDRGARKFHVSLPVLTLRLAELRVDSPPFIVLFFRFTENQSTGSDPQLRVSSSCLLGETGKLCVWRNRSAEGANLKSVVSLFKAWRNRLCEGTDPEGGRYSWHPDVGLDRTKAREAISSQENVNVSVLKYGKWKSVALSMTVASCLYARRGASAREANIVSVLTPTSKSN